MTTFRQALAAGDSIEVSGADLRVTPTSTLVTVSSPAVVVPPPPPPPPVTGGSGFVWPGTPPAGAKSYAKLKAGGASFAGMVKGLLAGETLVLDHDGIVSESVTGIALPAGVWLLPAPGAKFVLNGDWRVQGGHVYGLNVAFVAAAPDDHVCDWSTLPFEFGYAELWGMGCYGFMHPTGGVKNWRIHHTSQHDNPGPHGTANQDHFIYASAPSATQNGRIDHNLFQNAAHGRGNKVGGASGSTPIGGILIDHNTYVDCNGPASLQFSHGATNNRAENNVSIGGSSSTAFTEGSGCLPGNVCAGNWADRKVAPGGNVSDGGGNLVMPRAALLDYAANGAAGKGHLG